MSAANSATSASALNTRGLERRPAAFLSETSVGCSDRGTRSQRDSSGPHAGELVLTDSLLATGGQLLGAVLYSGVLCTAVLSEVRSRVLMSPDGTPCS